MQSTNRVEREANISMINVFISNYLFIKVQMYLLTRGGQGRERMKVKVTEDMLNHFVLQIRSHLVLFEIQQRKFQPNKILRVFQENNIWQQ